MPAEDERFAHLPMPEIGDDVVELAGDDVEAEIPVEDHLVAEQLSCLGDTGTYLFRR